ncbi:MAG TPA: DUF2203 domain-containing protein [Pyrinomonadaceae bacterium]|nr:DUF2203 domain-containing protein [Pyrinomonadaceae bacterium]
MKLFTVAEANALLPTVQGILKRIQHARKRLSSYQNQAKAAAEKAEQGGGGFSDGQRYANTLIELTAQTNELEVLGVQLKDFDRGLVDFPSLREGRVVLLCWQIGEGDEVEWWHNVDDGFAGRTPI